MRASYDSGQHYLTKLCASVRGSSKSYMMFLLASARALLGTSLPPLSLRHSFVGRRVSDSTVRWGCVYSKTCQKIQCRCMQNDCAASFIKRNICFGDGVHGLYQVFSMFRMHILHFRNLFLPHIICRTCMQAHTAPHPCLHQHTLGFIIIFLNLPLISLSMDHFPSS